MFWQGLTNLGGIVGVALATCTGISGPLIDRGAVWLARRNQGVYEPEFRIFFVGAMLLGVFAYAGWAGTNINFLDAVYSIRSCLPVGTTHNMPWIGAVACIAFVALSLDRFQSNIASSLVNFGLVVSSSAAITYVLDTHGGNALHVFAVTNFLKNMVYYGFTFFANGMVLDRGVKVSLLILAASQAFCWLLSIPMYRYGKRVRAFVSRRLAF